MSLIETFNNMVKEAQESESKQVEKRASQEVADEEMEILTKYASWAEDVLLEDRGEGNYTEEDVEKLAQIKLEEDAEELYNREKVAEAYEMGQIMYQGFKAAAEEDN